MPSLRPTRWLPGRHHEAGSDARARRAAPQTTRDPARQDVADLARAARILSLRSRRQAASLFAGGYSSGVRGEGVEFDELRPYVVGDDVRRIDWGATARTGLPHVRRFREERDQLVWILLDVSASMAFGTAGHSKARHAARAASLVAAAATHARDRVGLIAYADGVRTELAPARGEGQASQIVRRALAAADAASGPADLGQALARVARRPERGFLILISDLRDEPLVGAPGSRLGPALVEVARRHDLVCAAPIDPRERRLPRVGRLRLEPTDAAGPLWLASGRPRVRARYARAAAIRARDLERRIQGAGAELVWLDTRRDPLQPLARCFAARASRIRVAT